MSTEPLFRASLLALLPAALLCACTEVTIIASGGGGQGGEGEGSQGGESNPPPVVPCEQRGEADCSGGCVALVDWTTVVPGVPPTPPGTTGETEPCCPECAQEQCKGCHTPTFKRCIPVDLCAEPQPPEDCGVPLTCDK